jgi:predicted transcriptional regulator
VKMARNSRIDRAEVLALRDKGLKIREIAARLGCSNAAVEYHLYQKIRESMARRRNTQKYRKSAHEYYMKHYSDPEYRAKFLEHKREYTRNRYRSDPEFRARLREYKRSPKYLEYLRRRYRSDPEYRAKILKSKRNRYRSDPEFRAKLREYQNEYKRRHYRSDSEFRAKQLKYFREWYRRQRMERKKSEKL